MILHLELVQVTIGSPKLYCPLTRSDVLSPNSFYTLRRWPIAGAPSQPSASVPTPSARQWSQSHPAGPPGHRPAGSRQVLLLYCPSSCSPRHHLQPSREGTNPGGSQSGPDDAPLPHRGRGQETAPTSSAVAGRRRGLERQRQCRSSRRQEVEGVRRPFLCFSDRVRCDPPAAAGDAPLSPTLWPDSAPAGVVHLHQPGCLPGPPGDTRVTTEPAAATAAGVAAAAGGR